ncbi:hypothetical protein [Pectinatus haikarae]|uniref:hypothetical protein n=1 Tax=Pectinatus haikarae TaxID=349096 RepID=UPI0018C80206|nr:hypothetical protein [Pectinatus haikarae]
MLPVKANLAITIRFQLFIKKNIERVCRQGLQCGFISSKQYMGSLAFLVMGFGSFYLMCTQKPIIFFPVVELWYGNKEIGAGIAASISLDIPFL